jgi:hypothetical protein
MLRRRDEPLYLFTITNFEYITFTSPAYHSPDLPLKAGMRHATLAGRLEHHHDLLADFKLLEPVGDGGPAASSLSQLSTGSPSKPT